MKKTKNNGTARKAPKLYVKDIEDLPISLDHALLITGKTLPNIDGLSKQEIAFIKLRIIAEALNISDKESEGSGRFYPCFRFREAPENEHDTAVASSTVNYKAKLYPFLSKAQALIEPNVYITTMTYGFQEISPKVCTFPISLTVKSAKLCKFFANQFIDIWADYLGIL